LWTGPWIVEKFISPIVVQLSHPLNRKRQTVHVDRLVPCLTPSELPDSVVESEPEMELLGSAPVLPPAYDILVDTTDAGDASHSRPKQTRSGRTVRPPLRFT